MPSLSTSVRLESEESAALGQPSARLHREGRALSGQASWLLAVCAGVVAGGLSACDDRETSLEIRLQWQEPPADERARYLFFRLRPPAEGGPVLEVGPVRLPVSSIELRAIPLEVPLVAVAEARAAPYRNGRLLEQGISAEFSARPEERAQVTVVLVPARGPMAERSGPPPPDLERVVYRVAPWGQAQILGREPSADFELVGEPGAAAGGAEVRVYNASAVASATVLGQSQVAADGSFSVRLSQQSLDRPEPVHVGTVRGLEHSDTSTAPGLQAERAARIEWTATLGGKLPGTSFPNPHRLEIRRVTSPTLRPVVATEPDADALARMIQVGDGGVSAQAARRWIRISPFARPSPLAGRAAAYDATRGVTVVWGGPVLNALQGFEPSTTDDADTVWEWNGHSFLPVQPTDTVPDQRSLHTMAFDAARGVVVMYGGVDADGDLLEDLWAWDGRAWRELPPDGEAPPPLNFHSMAYDARRGRVVLFGGCLDSECVAFNPDTYEWDGSSWHRRSGEGAGLPRIQAATTFDASSGSVFAYGGSTDLLLPSGTLSRFDGARWTALSESLTSGLITAVSGQLYALGDGRLLLIGGIGLSPSLVWIWDGAAWSPVDTPGRQPVRRFFAAGAYDPIRREALLSGGVEVDDFGNLSGVLDETWIFDGTRWRDVFERGEGPRPAPRLTHGLAADPSLGEVVLAGGCLDFTCAAPPTESWSWNGFRWRRSPRSLAVGVGLPSVVADDRGIFVLGGDRGDAAGIEVTPGPVQRFEAGESGVLGTRLLPAGAAAAWDSVERRVLFFGGFDRSGPLDGFLQLGEAGSIDPVTESTPPPPARWLAGSAFDPGRNLFHLVGGATGGPRDGAIGTGLDDAWVWSSSTGWRPIPAEGLGRRYASGVAHHPADGLTYLFGGAVSGFPEGDRFLRDLWVSDGRSWIPLDQVGTVPGIRNAMPLTYDPGRGEIVTFGGYYLNNEVVVYDDTWVIDATDELRPSLVYETNLAASTLPSEALERIDIEVVAGGWGGGQEGILLDVWDHVSGTWVGAWTARGGPDTPSRVRISTSSAAEARRWAPGPTLHLRLRPSSIGPRATIAADALETTAIYRLPGR